MDLPEFLLARIAEDEEVAREATPSPWTYRSGSGLVHEGTAGRYTGGRDYMEVTGYRTTGAVDQDHIARHQPARVLAECEAKRLIVPLHQPMWLTWCPSPTCSVCIDFSQEVRPHPLGPPTMWQPHQTWPCPTLRVLASVYADHPDYQAEWAS